MGEDRLKKMNLAIMRKIEGRFELEETIDKLDEAKQKVKDELLVLDDDVEFCIT